MPWSNEGDIRSPLSLAMASVHMSGSNAPTSCVTLGGGERARRLFKGGAGGRGGGGGVGLGNEAKGGR